MNKGEMVKVVAQATDNAVPVVQEIVDTFLRVLTLTLAVGEEVTFRGYGRFESRPRPPKTLKNPRTGELIHVPARNTVVFLPSANLKDRMNGDTP